MCYWRCGDPLETVGALISRIVLLKDYDMAQNPKSSCIETTYQIVSVKNSVESRRLIVLLWGLSNFYRPPFLHLPVTFLSSLLEFLDPVSVQTCFSMKQAFCKMQFPLAQSALPSLESSFLFACFNSFVEI